MASAGFFERTEGNKSMMRLLAFLGLLLGAVVAIWGMVLTTVAVAAVIKGSVAAAAVIGSLLLMVGGGLGLAGGGEVLKMAQQRGEVREANGGERK